MSWVLWCVLAAAPAEQVELSNLPDDRGLMQLLWDHSPLVTQARARIGAADADVLRAELLPNPSLDLSLNSVPVGDTNPKGLSLGETANAAIGISELVELGKRGPRQRAATAMRTSAVLDVSEVVRQQYLELMLKGALVASSQVRIAALSDAVVDAARLSGLQAARSGQGDSAGLDTERARLEQQKIESTLGAERENLEQALHDCAHVAGVPCTPFADPVLAQRFLDAAHGPATADPSQRPDLKSLEAQVTSANELAVLAERRAVPDPTVRVGYVRDQFVVSGNDPNTLFVGVSLPLPVFDRGQADAQTARVQSETAARTRSLLMAQALNEKDRLERALVLALARQKTLRERTLPLARRVVASLDKALLVGAPLQDLLLARRTLEELNVESADVDLLVFQTSLELQRVLGGGPELPLTIK